MREFQITIRCRNEEKCDIGCNGFNITKNGASCNIFRGCSLRTDVALMNGYYEEHTFRCEACKEIFDKTKFKKIK